MKTKLKDSSLLETHAFMCGKWVACDKTFTVTNPANGQTVAEVADMSVADLNAAIDSAEKAQIAWRQTTALHRADILMRWYGLLMENKEDLACILTAEMGKPISEARGEVAYGAGFIRWFAEEARRTYGDVIPGHQVDKRILVLKQPIGVVGSITPWNFPIAMIARKVAPALAAGCTFVARPAEQTPLSALAMAVLAERAGIPESVFSVVTSTDSQGFGFELCTNPKIRKVTFTGSTEVGRILMRQCSNDIKKISLELGGNAPFIVFDDADIDAAVQGVLIAKFRNSGQTCVCANRIYAQSGIHDEFVEKLASAVSKLRLGNGMDEDVHIGPIIDRGGVKKVQEHLEDAVLKGAQIVSGGKCSDLGEQFFEPTVIANVNDTMRLMGEETFGPLAPIIRFETETEVLEAANNTEFGLASYFYTKDVSRVFRFGEALEYGMVGVNTGLISTPEAPFGGIKSSGLGREGSKYGMDDYLELKYMCLEV